jgi:hypothetical protein
MSQRTIQATIVFLEKFLGHWRQKNCDERQYITIGGGEPTLHPNFWEIMGVALKMFPFDMENFVPSVAIVTNGSVEKTSIRLANMAKNGEISATLSADQYHAGYMVSQATRDAFGQPAYIRSRDESSEQHDFRDVRGSVFPIPVGRAKTTGVGHSSQKNRCICSCLFIKSSGSIHFCGCPSSPRIGNVFEGLSDYGNYILSMEDDEYERYSCYRQLPKGHHQPSQENDLFSLAA